MRAKQLRHEFVEFIPNELEEGVLYISTTYATASHLCACGCRQKVITPFSPTDWCLVFDGDSVSLKPSIGNWSFPCRSHYVIARNRIRWAEDWSRAKIEAGRDRDRRAKQRYFNDSQKGTQEQGAADPGTPDPKSSLIRRWISRLRG